MRDTDGLFVSGAVLFLAGAAIILTTVRRLSD